MSQLPYLSFELSQEPDATAVHTGKRYLIKLQKRCADKLTNFIHDLKEKVISLDHVFWDDTVVKLGLLESTEGFDEKDLEYLEKIKNDENKKRQQNKKWDY